MNKLTFFLACLLAVGLGSLYGSDQPSGIKFTENTGQWQSHILFKAQLDGGALFVEANALSFNFYDKKKLRAMHLAEPGAIPVDGNVIGGHAYKIKFKNANPNPFIEQMGRGPDVENFFLGKDKTKWRSGVANFKTIWYHNLYPGIDYELEAQQAGFKYNFHVKANANPSVIQVSYEGVMDLKLADNVLSYGLSVTDAIELRPYAYQLIDGQKIEVECRYKLSGNVLSFDFPNGYDRQAELVIDPVLVFAAQIGSVADNWTGAATWDIQGNLYSGGTGYGVGYPTTLGAYSTTFTGVAGTDAVITKYDASGTSLLYSTYLGGTGMDMVTSLIVDHSNNLCIYGVTSSTNFPVTAGAFDQNFNGGTTVNFSSLLGIFYGGTDLYVAKLNTNGSVLLGSTYLGGSGNDGINHTNTTWGQTNPPQYVEDSLVYNHGDEFRGEIQVDDADNIYIAGTTRSNNFPLTPNNYDNTLGGVQDAIVAKFDPSLGQLLYSTYLGGSYKDCGNALAINRNQDVIITGGTCSPDFPLIAGCYAMTYAGGKTDAFVSKISTTNGQLLRSTFFGTNAYDQSYFVKSGPMEEIYIFGQSRGNVPVVGQVYSNPGTHQFVAKFDLLLSNLLISTVFGNDTYQPEIAPLSFGVDLCGNIYLSGWGGNVSSFVVTAVNMPMASATQNTTDGRDVYLMRLSPNAGSLIYGSYFGGNQSPDHVDGGMSRIDKTGTFYQSVCASCQGFDDFPVTPGAWPLNVASGPNLSNNCNNGVFKISAQTGVVASNIIANTTMGCAPLTVSLTNGSANYTAYQWNLGGGVVNSTGPNPSVTFTTPGTYTISLVASDPFSCNLTDTSFLYIQVTPFAGGLNILPSNTIICAGETSLLVASSAATTYSWSTGSSASVLLVSPTVTTTYSLTATDANGCSTTTAYTQLVDACTGIATHQTESNTLWVYPNPSHESLTISSDTGIEELSIFNAYGQLIYTENVNVKSFQVNVSQFPTGVYLLCAKLNDNAVISRKIVKE